VTCCKGRSVVTLLEIPLIHFVGLLWVPPSYTLSYALRETEGHMDALFRTAFGTLDWVLVISDMDTQAHQ
jgi:hypothetical protein